MMWNIRKSRSRNVWWMWVCVCLRFFIFVHVRACLCVCVRACLCVCVQACARRRSLRTMFGWINQILVGPTIQYGYYTDNQIFGWANKIFLLIKFGWLYHYFGWSNQILWLIYKGVFARANNNFIISVIIIIVIINIVIENSNNNILFKKKEKKIRDRPKDTLFQTGFEPATFEFPTYLPNYLTRPNDLGCPTICVFRCF